jgi:hypothetical protein
VKLVLCFLFLWLWFVSFSACFLLIVSFLISLLVSFKLVLSFTTSFDSLFKNLFFFPSPLSHSDSVRPDAMATNHTICHYLHYSATRETLIRKVSCNKLGCFIPRERSLAGPQRGGVENARPCRMF